MGDVVDSGMGLSYRRASLCSLAGLYINNPMSELTLSVRDYELATGVHFMSTHQPDWARICNCLRSPGIDSKESIPPGYVCWRHRFLDNYKFGLWAHTTIMTEETVVDTTCENLWWQCLDGQSPCRSQKRKGECTLWPRLQRLGCRLGSLSYLHNRESKMFLRAEQAVGQRYDDDQQEALCQFMSSTCS